MGSLRRVVLVAALGLSACSGGGGGGGTSISVSPKSLTFVQEVGDSYPPAQPVAVSYKGDGLLVGYPPDEFRTDLVYVNDLGGDGRAHDFQIGLGGVSLAAPGELHTTVRFVTGREDGSQIKHQDVAVTYRMVPSTFSSTLTPTSLQFQAATLGTPPAPQAVEIEISDGEIVAAVIGLEDATVDLDTPAGQPATARVSFGTNFVAGLHTGSVILTVERDNGSIRNLVIPVEYTVTPTTTVSPATLSYVAMAGNSAAATPATRSFTISGGPALDWVASSDQPWLALAQTSGSEPGEVAFSVNHAGLEPGVHEAQIAVQDAFSGATRTLDVSLAVAAPQLAVNPAQPRFTVNGASRAGDLAQVVSVGDEADGAPEHAIAWTVRSISQPWLEVAPAAGSSFPEAELTLTVDQDDLGAVENGTHSATIVLAYTDAAGVARTYNLPVELNLAMSRVNIAAPYLGIENRADRVVLRGAGFAGMDPAALRVGDAVLSSVDVVSDTELHVTYPGLAVGDYDISIDNALGLDLSPAELVIVAARELPYAAFTVDGYVHRLVFDQERGTLYMVNPAVGNNRIERYAVVDGAWTALAPIPLADLQDAALSLDGRTLHIVAHTALYDLDLEDPMATPVARHSMAPGHSGQVFYRMSVANDGHGQIASSSTCCSGVWPLYDWTLGTGTVTKYPYPIGTQSVPTLGSADGSVVYFGGDYRYLASSGTLSEIAGAGFYPSAISADGSIVANTRYTYDSDFTQLGAWHEHNVHVVFGRADRAYGVRTHDGDSIVGTNVLVFDVSDTTPAGGVYPQIRQVAIPEGDMPSMAFSYLAQSAVSADDRTYFLRTPERMVIVPVGD